MFGFIALVTLALSLWSFSNDRIVIRESQATTMGTVLAKERRQDHSQNPKWHNLMQVDYLRKQGWFYVERDVYDAHHPGSQIQIIYSLVETKGSAYVAPTTSRTKYYLLAVSLASMVVCICLLTRAKRIRRDDRPHAPSLDEALRQARI